MASKLGEVFVELTAIDSKYKTSLKKAQGDAEKTATAIEKRWQSMGAALSGAIAALGLLAAAKFAVTEAIAAEAAQVKLAAALALTGDASRANLEAFDKFAKSIQAVTTYEDDAILATMAYGKSIGIPTSKLIECTRAAIGLAEITDKDLHGAMLNVGRAAQGVFGRLKMLLPSFKETGDAAVDFANLLKLTEGGFSLAEARAKTAGGALEQMHVAIQNLGESFGMVLLPAVKALGVIIKPVAEWLSSLSPIIKASILVIGGLAVVVTVAVVALGSLAAMWGNVAVKAAAAAVAQWAATNRLALAAGAILAIGGAITGITIAMNSASKDMDDYMDKLNKTLKGTAGTINEISDAGKKVAEAAGAQPIIGVNMESLKEKYDEEGKAIYEVYKGIRAAREEDEKRMRSAIGWTAIGDIWKGAAVAGATHRFPGPMERQEGWTSAQGVRYGYGKPIIDKADWNRAVEWWKMQQKSLKQIEGYLGLITNARLRESDLA